MGAPVMRIEARRQSDDCAAWALSTFLGVPYDKVWQTVVRLDRSKGKNGLHVRTMMRIAEALGKPLLFKKKFDLHDSYGIIDVEDKTKGHVAVLRNGLVFDTDSTNWEVDAWLKHNRFVVLGLITDKEE